MFVAKISFQKHGVDDSERATDAADDLLSCWHNNGQLIGGDSWVISNRGTSLEAYVVIPEVDALEVLHNNSYANQAAATCGQPTITILGRASHLPSCCACPSRTGLVLFTHYMTRLPPVRCLDCFAPVALYRLPHLTNEEYLDFLHWAADYRACDTLQMHCATGERFGEQQLARHDSSLSRNGRALCAKLERATETPVYYFLHKIRSRGRESEFSRRCPSCDSAWRLKRGVHAFDFRCDTCRLLSAIAADVP